MQSIGPQTKFFIHKRMKPKQEGPFAITKVLGPVTYRLKLLTSWWIHNIFHATLLKPYRENEIYWENFTEPPPELVEGEEVYEVKTIHGHRKQGQGYQYYIQWRGYPISDARTCIFWWWQNIGWLQKTPPPLTFLLSPSRHMFPYQHYNMDEELLDCLEIIYDLINFFDDIRLALETEKDLIPIIHWPFNPFKTIGKY